MIVEPLKYMGPRVTSGEFERHKVAYLLPTLLLLTAAILLLVSIFVPIWKMDLEAPQYPDGLHVKVYANKMTGDVREIDGLNHYIGMRPLGDAAKLERSLSVAAIAVISALVLATIFVHTRWAALLALPALLYPGVFLLDLYLWLRHFGLNLDPTAALSSSVDPFVPAVIGSHKVANFYTIGSVEIGFYLALAASALIIVGLYYHRRAYRRLSIEVDGGDAEA